MVNATVPFPPAPPLESSLLPLRLTRYPRCLRRAAGPRRLFGAIAATLAIAGWTANDSAAASTVGECTITLTDAGGTISVTIGTVVLVRLSRDLGWSGIKITSDGNAIERNATSTFRGQRYNAVFVATHEGTATLSAVGRPFCRAKPGMNCPQYVQGWRAMIHVAASDVGSGQAPEKLCRISAALRTRG